MEICLQPYGHLGRNQLPQHARCAWSFPIVRDGYWELQPNLFQSDYGGKSSGVVGSQ